MSQQADTMMIMMSPRSTLSVTQGMACSSLVTRCSHGPNKAGRSAKQKERERFLEKCPLFFLHSDLPKKRACEVPSLYSSPERLDRD